MTNNYSIILPLMVANITSYVVAGRLSPRPIYDALLMQDGVHLPHNERQVLREITVSAAMTHEVVTVPGDMTVESAFKHVQSLPEYHHAYPIVDQDGRVVGILTFNDLKRALAEGNIGLNGKKVLFIWLRGANDGLNSVIPVQDSAYYSIRQQIAIQKELGVDYSATGGCFDATQFADGAGTFRRMNTVIPLHFVITRVIR